jgi:anti-sigma factor RsiW
MSAHFSPEQIEAAAFGRLGEAEAAQVRAHAAGCARCRRRLAADDEVHRRLAPLADEQPPAVDVVEQVMERIDAHERGDATDGVDAAARRARSAPGR